MNRDSARRLLKIDPMHTWSHSGEPRVNFSVRGCDKDGDSLSVDLSAEDAKWLLLVMQNAAKRVLQSSEEILSTSSIISLPPIEKQPPKELDGD
jgi:hypothetical protein